MIMNSKERKWFKFKMIVFFDETFNMWKYEVGLNGATYVTSDWYMSKQFCTRAFIKFVKHLAQNFDLEISEEQIKEKIKYERRSTW